MCGQSGGGDGGPAAVRWRRVGYNMIVDIERDREIYWELPIIFFGEEVYVGALFFFF